MMGRLMADAEALEAQGIGMTRYGANMGLNKVTISVLHYSAQAAGTLYAAYGTDLIVVSTTSKAPVRRARPDATVLAEPQSRADTSAPG